jgi:hypothetical protein
MGCRVGRHNFRLEAGSREPGVRNCVAVSPRSAAYMGFASASTAERSCRHCGPLRLARPEGPFGTQFVADDGTRNLGPESNCIGSQ